MPVTTQVKVVVDAKDNASKVLRGIKGSLLDLSKSTQNLGSDLKTIGRIAIAGAAGLLALGVKAGFSAARVEELTFALYAIAKANDISQDAADASVASLRDMNITHQKALQITSLFIQSQLDLADATKIATAAKDLAVIAGLDSSEATETLTRAIVMQRPMLLKQFGIVSGLDQIYKKYSESIGKSASNLTELEKRQAFLNTILEAGEKVTGTYEAAMGSVSKRFRSLTGRIIPDFMAKIGEAFSPAIRVFVDSLANSIKEMSQWMDDNKDTIEDWGKKAEKAATMIVEGFGKLFNFIKNNKEIIVGVLIAVGVAVGALVVAFLAAHAVAILVFTGIVAVVVIFMKSLGNLKKGIEALVGFFKNKALPAVKQFFQKLVSGAKDLRDKVIDKFNLLKDRLNLIKQSIGVFVETAKRKFGDFKSAVKDKIEAAKETFELVKQSVKEFGEKLVTFFQELPGRISEGIDFLKEKLITFFLEDLPYALGFAVGTLERWVAEDIPAFIESMATAFRNMVIALTEVFTNFFTVTIPELWTTFVTFLTEQVPMMAEQFVLWITDMLARAWLEFLNFATVTVPGAIQSLIDWLSVTIPNLANRFVQWITKLATDAWNAIVKFYKNTVATLTKLKDDAIAKVIALYNSFIKWIRQLVADVIAGINSMPGKVGAAMDRVKSAAISKAKEIYEGVKGWFDKIINFFDKIISKAGEALGRAREAFRAGREAGGMQAGGIVPGPIGAPVPILAHGGERVIPAGVGIAEGGEGGGGVTFSVNIGLYAGAETEKRNIARELYASLLQVAQSQNKSVKELMGG